MAVFSVLLLLAGASCTAGLRLTEKDTPEWPWGPKPAAKPKAKARTFEDDGRSGPSYPWAGSSGNRFRTGAVAATAPRVLQSAPSWSWREEVEKGMKSARFPNFTGLIRAAPLVDERSNIYLSAVSSGSIYKISPEGKTVWKHMRSAAKLPGVSSIMKGKLFSADTSGKVFSLDMESGASGWETHIGRIADDAWSLAAGEDMIIAPAINEEMVAKSAEQQQNTRLVALRAADGSVAWKFDVQEGAKLVNALVSIRAGSCVFSDNKGNIYRLDLKTGEKIWNSKKMAAVPVQTVGAAIIDPSGEKVYATWNEAGWEVNHMTLSGKVGAFNFTDGRLLWVYSTQYPTDGPPAVGLVDNHLVVIVGTGMSPSAPDPAMGVLSGQGEEHKARVTLIYAEGSREGTHMFWRDVDSYYGAAAGDDARPDPCQPRTAFSGPTIGGDGTLYLGYQNGDLVTIHDDNHDGYFTKRELSRYHMGTAFNAAPVVTPGMLVVATCDGLHVWKFSSESTPATV